MLQPAHTSSSKCKHFHIMGASISTRPAVFSTPPIPNRGAQTAFILILTFLDLRPVSAANDLQTSINGRLEIRLSKSKTPV
jgi:hypothetical protein